MEHGVHRGLQDSDPTATICAALRGRRAQKAVWFNTFLFLIYHILIIQGPFIVIPYVSTVYLDQVHPSSIIFPYPLSPVPLLSNII
jgi:hypothetical protein